MLAAAEALRHLSFTLRRISARHLRSILRPFFLAGWTIADVRLAIDQRPDGTLWPHSGADGVDNLGAWLKYRLRAWVDDHGTVRRSPSQKAHDRQLEAIARRRAAREAAQAARSFSSGPTKEYLEAKARLLASAPLSSKLRR